MATPITNSSLALHRRAIVRLSALLYLIGAAIAGGVILLPSMRDVVQPAPAAGLIALAVLSAPAVYLFPWHKFNPNWFIVIGCLASAHVTLFMWATGGAQSPFWPLVIFILLVSTAYYSDTWPLVLLTVLAFILILSPLTYDPAIPDSFFAHAAVQSLVVASSFFIGRLIFRNLDRSVLQVARLENERELVQERQQLLNVVTHELKNPLTIVTVYGELLEQQTDLTSSSRTMVRGMREGWERMRSLIADLEEFNGLQAALTLERKETDLRALVEHEAAQLAPMDGKHEVRVEAPVALPHVQVDQRRIVQVVDNLLTNAIRYSPRGGRVVISLRPADGGVEVAVADQGVGIPREAQGRLFTPFYRAKREDIEGIRGTGLGLAICKTIVEAHGGRIWVESEQGKGATFRFTVPTAPPERASAV